MSAICKFGLNPIKQFALKDRRLAPCMVLSLVGNDANVQLPLQKLEQRARTPLFAAPGTAVTSCPALASHAAFAKVEADLERAGRTVMVVRQDEAYLGVLGLMDTERAAARDVIARLKRLGIQRMIMLTGDNQSVADAIARQVGLTDAKGGLMPEDKVAFIKDLRKREGKVAMVGDGVNDAPALANATVGIAMGAAGSDVALETADIALMADDLNHLPFAVGLSRQTSNIIKQNLWVSLGVVAVLIPSTLFGLQIGAAIIFHEGSTVLVVFNALRLLAYRHTGADLLGERR